MLIIAVNSEIIKITFNANEENLLLGDKIKITNKEGNGVLVQAVKIDSSRENPANNVASCKIILSVSSFNKWTNWKGNVPSTEFKIEKISDKELLAHINGLKPDYPVNLGKLSLYKDTDLIIDAALLEKPTVILCDKQIQRTNISPLLACELTRHSAKAIILDFRGEYSHIEHATRLEAGKDFKLPLNSKGIECLYEKSLNNISAETRAIIEDIFMSIQEYADSSESGFIPLTSFKNVIEQQYEENDIDGLVLLKNNLTKFEKQGIFANSGMEIESLNLCLQKSNLVIVDFSTVSPIWHKDFVEFIVNSNIEKYNQPFFLILEARENNLDDNLISKMYVQGYRSGIRPIISVGYESKLLKPILSVSKNMILYSPKVILEKFSDFQNYFARLSLNEAIIYGELSKSIPLIVKINGRFTENMGQINSIFSPIKINQPVISEYEPAGSEPDPIQEIEEIETENPDESYEIYEHYDESEDDLESLEYISQNAETVSNDEDLYDIAEDYYPEDKDYESIEVQEISDDFNYDYSEQDFEEFQTYQENPEDQDPYQETVPQEIYNDVDSLYTAKKIDSEPQPEIEPDYEDFSLEEEFEEEITEVTTPNIPIYSTSDDQDTSEKEFDLKEGDKVKHQKYGIGIINKIIGYGNKKLCSIQFENVGRRLLDPQLAVIEKVE